MSVPQLRDAAAALGELRERTVFIGGATIGLWFSDPGARPPRVTYDVDVVVEVATLAEYAAFQSQLRHRGFTEDMHSGVAIRYRHAALGVVLDALPLELRLAGMSARWLPIAACEATTVELASGLSLRVLAPAWLVVTKLEALASRGNDDLLASSDFEDLVLLVDSRPELGEEIGRLPAEAAAYVRRQMAALVTHPAFVPAVQGALPGGGGAGRSSQITIPRLQSLANG